MKRPNNHVQPICNDDGSWAGNNTQKAELFAEYLSNTFQPQPRQTTDLPNNNSHDKLLLKPVKLNEVANKFAKILSSKKAPGYYLITGQITKELPEKGIIKLTHLINAAFRLRSVPMQWKVAEILVIPEPGNPPNDKTSYRSISLIPIISNVFDKLFLKRLKPVIEERKLILSHRFGYRN